MSLVLTIILGLAGYGCSLGGDHGIHWGRSRRWLPGDSVRGAHRHLVVDARLYGLARTPMMGTPTQAGAIRTGRHHSRGAMPLELSVVLCGCLGRRYSSFAFACRASHRSL